MSKLLSHRKDNRSNGSFSNNELRRKYLSALHIALTEEPSKCIILVAWILIVINGILDENTFNLLVSKADGKIDDLPWHSDEPLDVKTWIPDDYLSESTINNNRKFVLFKLKSYYNHFYYSLFRNHFFTIKRLRNGEVSFNAEKDDLTVNELFCSQHYPTIYLQCSEEVLNKMNKLSNLKTFSVDNNNFIIVGAATLVIKDNSTRIVTLRVSETKNSSNRIFYKITSKQFRRYVFPDFNKDLVSDTHPQRYTLESSSPFTNLEFEGIHQINFSQGLSFSPPTRQTRSIRRKTGETLTSERFLGCFFIDNIDDQKIVRSEKIEFQFIAEEPQQPYYKYDMEAPRSPKTPRVDSLQSPNNNSKYYYDSSDDEVV